MKKLLIGLLVVTVVLAFSAITIGTTTNVANNEIIYYSCGGGDDDMPCPLDALSG